MVGASKVMFWTSAITFSTKRICMGTENSVGEGVGVKVGVVVNSTGDAAEDSDESDGEISAVSLAIEVVWSTTEAVAVSAKYHRGELVGATVVVTVMVSTGRSVWTGTC